MVQLGASRLASLPERVRHEGYRRHQVPGEIYVPQIY